MRKYTDYKLIFTLLFVLLSLETDLQAQSGKIVLIQGKVKNGTNGSVLGTTLVFVSEKGKKTICKSNSSDGSYQQSLNSGEVYHVFIKDFIPVNEELVINIPPVEKYEELTRDILVNPIKPGVEIMKERVFESNDSTIINKIFIYNLKHFIDLNPTVKLNILVSSYDSWFNKSRKKIEKTNSKGKKYFKTVTYSTKDQLSDLLDSRIKMLNMKFKTNGVFVKDNILKKDLRVVDERKKRERRKIEGKKNKYEYYIPDFPNVIVTIVD